MRLTIITIAAFAGFALAQGQGGLDLPTCAVSLAFSYHRYLFDISMRDTTSGMF